MEEKRAYESKGQRLMKVVKDAYILFASLEMTVTVNLINEIS